MVFKDRATQDIWRTQVETLVRDHHHNSIRTKRSLNSVRDSVLSGTTDSAKSTNTAYSSSTTASSKYSRTTTSSNGMHSKELGALNEDSEAYYHHGRQPMQQAGDSTSTLLPFGSPVLPASINLPHDFPAIDLMLIFSVPMQTNAPSSFHLKLRLIKSTLDFIVAHAGPRARISLVTYATGDGPKGMLRKTPFLAVGRDDGRQRLQAAIDQIGSDVSSDEDAGSVDQREERVNVVTAVNLGMLFFSYICSSSEMRFSIGHSATTQSKIGSHWSRADERRKGWRAETADGSGDGSSRSRRVRPILPD